MSRRREESDLVRVLAMSREAGNQIGAERASQHAMPSRSTEQLDTSGASKRRKTKSSLEGTADVFQSRTPPRSATRMNSKRGTPERRRSREASSMKIGNEIYSGEPINENINERDTARTSRQPRQPDLGYANSESETKTASQSETGLEAHGHQNQAAEETPSATAANSSKATENNQAQRIQSSTDSVQELQELQPSLSNNAYASTETEQEEEDRSQSNVTDAKDTDLKTDRGESEPPSLSSSLDARRRLFGKPLTKLIAQRKASPHTSRMAGLTRTSRIPPLHTHRKPPPPAKPRFVTSKPAVQKPADSDEEAEPEPEIDYENEGFL
ncbi:hypothetical protein MYAM1_003078 [Malassezia yamatoensis]|uniref:Uncharacterized protein n=1 Tax=Malassezia yamatoensis TaxID=253288 RepID=A0AAJ5Z137_9BASI|nr:hypothetical protein MYAM1_003078 [Malassezia yamatoensis]